jgi:hypothetical protein
VRKENRGFHPSSRRCRIPVPRAQPLEIRHMATSLIFGVLGLGVFLALVLRLATYALPTFAAMATGSWMYQTGAGAFAAIVAGIFVGAVTLFAGQIALGAIRSNFLRAIIALIFAVPAVVAGYHMASTLGQLGDCPKFLGQVFAVASAAITGIVATSRLTRTL